MNILRSNPASTPDQARAFLTAAVAELGDCTTGKTLSTTLSSIEHGEPAVYLGRLSLVDDRYTRPLFTIFAAEMDLSEDYRGSEVFPLDSLTEIVRSALAGRRSGSQWKAEAAKLIRDVMLSAFNGSVAVRLNLHSLPPDDFAHLFHVLEAMFVGTDHGSFAPRSRRRRLFDADVRQAFIVHGGESFFFAPLHRN